MDNSLKQNRTIKLGWAIAYVLRIYILVMLFPVAMTIRWLMYDNWPIIPSVIAIIFVGIFIYLPLLKLIKDKIEIWDWKIIIEEAELFKKNRKTIAIEQINNIVIWKKSDINAWCKANTENQKKFKKKVFLNYIATDKHTYISIAMKNTNEIILIWTSGITNKSINYLLDYLNSLGFKINDYRAW